MLFFMQIYDAYKSGNDAFKDLTQRYGLTPEMVDDAMVQVQEVRNTTAVSLFPKKWGRLFCSTMQKGSMCSMCLLVK